jgi:transcriptional antiterminator RfaH
MSIETIDPCARWYAIHTKTREEERADSNLRASGVETFAPRIRARRQMYAGGVSYFTKPLFPRYIFARFDVNRLYRKVSFTRGVNRIVSFDGNPAVVDDCIVDLIRSRVGGDGCVRINDEFEAGDHVIIRNGPLTGFTGVFERGLKDADRIMILLTTVNYRPRIVIERELVHKQGALAA